MGSEGILSPANGNWRGFAFQNSLEGGHRLPRLARVGRSGTHPSLGPSSQVQATISKAARADFHVLRATAAIPKSLQTTDGKVQKFSGGRFVDEPMPITTNAFRMFGSGMANSNYAGW
jgi:hypothetical protein